MSEASLRPYKTIRDLDQDAWFLYQSTSLRYYEECARLCEQFAELHNNFLTGQRLHGQARLDYWVSRYLTHAYNIRRGIDFIENGGDYMPMIGSLNEPTTDYRGLVEQPLGWMSDAQRKQWDDTFQRLSYACGTGKTTLSNNRTKGRQWLNRSSITNDRKYLDRDDSHPGDRTDSIKYAKDFGILSPPSTYPRHTIDSHFTISPGEPCPRTGVWVPAQWLGGENNFSLAFCVQGQPMQPAYRIIGLKVSNPFAGFDDEMAAEYEAIAKGSPVTQAVDTTWTFVEKASDSPQQPECHERLRSDSNLPCPKTGYWMTPAKAGSRRFFRQGEIMPVVASDYGETIWQWDLDQSDPRL
ncbi:conserved hypothetical protein [Cupriavidus taiwanensis]|uniref:hypothetical protein n=1 Tax=Cupriavidus taiwanensis TaxID=164546 RepID=UPI000E175A26|nr:hypothetical protein [Cupriavidus taiwanensis]SOZ20189.1 conserved hypothetical protein [Cupriavidus taiwanensis]SOZ33404.1 conserved hypothetical protein [Cupriavidus taiwanensis]SOZ48716.1 conserved hypothetical protein [Cupriavidus taiwanensis]SPA01354.1 conserved hypothetical protein [Cupriavidus taiwanensis]SPA22794.1 conserved hypothetical protein [Cupriavidus taiwanensis]